MSLKWILGANGADDDTVTMVRNCNGENERTFLSFV
jgi:hypothetical protein